MPLQQLCKACFVVALIFLVSSIQINADTLLSRRVALPYLLRQSYRRYYNNNRTTTIIASASEFLGKFGWVKPKDWLAVSPRSNETIEEEISWNNIAENQTDNDGERSTIPSMSASHLSPQEFASALRNFQQANGLRVTGLLDGETMRIMSRPRCGVPDQTMENNRSRENLQINPPNSGSLSQLLARLNRPTTQSSMSRLSGVQRRLRRATDSRIRLQSALMSDQLTPYKNEDNQPRNQAFSEFDNGISEGEPTSHNRVENIEEVLNVLQEEKLMTKDKMLQNSSSSHLIEKITVNAVLSAIKRRRKRSNSFRDFRGRGGWGMAFSKNTITWRLVREWPTVNNQHMTRSEMAFTLKLAFRIWSEVLPRNFQEDNYSLINNVDILIGFGQNKHNRCPVEFKSGLLTQEFAHAWALPKAEIHLNDAQMFVPVGYMAANSQSSLGGRASNPISFLKVAIHEIGHALGLFHSENRVSIMNPYYQPFEVEQIVELSIHDRENIKNIYGTCDVSFNAVFDWVRQSRHSNGQVTWKYNTYFFRNSWYWLYENRVQRPRYGDPRLTATYWRGVIGFTGGPVRDIDGVVHIRSWQSLEGPTFFFKGNYYIEYDNNNDRVKTQNAQGQAYPRLIGEDFPGVPHPIDTVFYNFNEDLLYFFKNTKVYRFRWASKSLLDSASISGAFPGWGGSPSLPDNIDAAYYSYAYQAYYFFKGNYYWKLADERERVQNRQLRIPYNAVGPRQKISSKWKYICDVGPSELVLNVPTS